MDSQQIRSIASDVVTSDNQRKFEAHYKGAFVNETIEYMRKKIPLKISSFVAKGIQGIIIKADSQKICIRKDIDGKCMWISQASIKLLEEI